MGLIIVNSTVIIQDNATGQVLFKGNENDLCKLIKDARLLAESIRMDINAGYIKDEENEGMEFVQYNDFSLLYEAFPK